MKNTVRKREKIMKPDYKERMEYCPSHTRVKIYLFLEKCHLVTPIKKVIQKIRIVREKIGFPSKYVSPEQLEMLKREEAFHRSYHEFFQEIEDYKLSGILCNAVISGYISTFAKGGNRFFQKLNEQMPELEWIVISQSGRKITQKRKSKIAFDILSVPRVPFKGGYDKKLNIMLTEEMKSVIAEREYLHDAIYNVKSYHDDMGEGYPEALVYYTHLYTKVLVEKLQPKILIVHNKLYPMHDVMMNTCKELGVKTLFFEFGALPGTFALEKQGQMGGSHVATDYENFKLLSINDEELKKAEKVCKYLKERGLNRNVQPLSDQKEELFGRLKADRPIILYAGQNDYDSGICPYKENSKKLHSPIFKNSDEAAVFLAGLAQKNDWNLIYKPHPLPVKHGRCLQEGLPDNVIWISDIDINEIIDMSDVVVTILSQVADISLIRDKATLMLGYTQLRGKDCCYEAYEVNSIEVELKKAIEEGYTTMQRKAFVRHVARELKYYLYDDLADRNLRFGRNMKECAEYMKENIDMEQIERDENWLFYCRNVYELEVILNIVNTLNIKCHKHLILSENEELHHFALTFNGDNEFEKIFQYDFQKLEGPYTQLFIPTIKKDAEQLYYHLINNVSVPKVHLYDNGRVEEYYQDIPKTLKKDEFKHEFYREKALIQQLEGIWLYELSYMIWRNVNAKYHKIQHKFIFQDDWDLLENVKEKYIFIETNLFKNKVISNEMDLLDLLAEKVGKENICVKLFDEGSRMRFEMRGYRAIFVSDNQWFFEVRKGYLENKHLISLYPIDVYMKYTNVKEVYLYKLFVGKLPILKSNSFRKFMQVYMSEQDDTSHVVLEPRDIAEYHEFVKYLERNEY